MRSPQIHRIPDDRCKFRFAPGPCPARNTGIMKAVHICFPLTILLVACSTPSTSTTQRSSPGQAPPDRYATQYLGANNRVVTKFSEAAKEQRQGYWHGGGSGSPSIVIDLGQQEARFYRGGDLIGMSPISSGREGYRTPTGNFSIIQKDRDHLSNLYGDYVDADGNIVVRNVGIMENRRPPGTSFRGAPMPYFMRITGGVGMHTGYLPGVADSHGCIRMPGDMAEIFYNHVSTGTPVRVTH